MTPAPAPPLPPDAPAPEGQPRIRPVALPAVALDAWEFRIFRRTAR
ncbi:MAG: hypothetical protein H0V27_10570 [Pyrinomonadaceae bacterium]|nr:hypothetical protein [Pyrinomonadaceae bacterium]